jgi:HEAT repeat protein
MAQNELQALVADVDRLLVAGATVAVSDDGLRRRAASLRQLGQKVPLLAQVADAVERVTAARPVQASPALLDLLGVVRQIRAGLVKAGVDGPLEPLPPSGPWRTDASAHDVYGLTEAETGSGTSRTAILKEALERPGAADLRLVDFLLERLGIGSYDATTERVTEQALVGYGPAILPELERGLDLKGKVGHARRLRALCRLDARRGAELCRQALADGGPTVQAEAVRSLGRLDPEAAERAALELLARKPARDLRAAILTALAGARSDAALDALVEDLGSQDDFLAHLAAGSLGKIAHAGTPARLLQALDKTVAELDAPRPTKAKTPAPKGKGRAAAPPPSPDAARAALVARIQHLTRILGRRKDPQATAPLAALLAHKLPDVREAALHGLQRLGAPAGLEAAAGLLEDAKVWRAAAGAVWLLPAKPRYDHLAPLCADLSHAKKPQRQRGEFVLQLFEAEATGQADDVSEDYYFYVERDEDTARRRSPRTDWDPRWAPLLRKHLKGPNRPGVAIALGVVLGPAAIPELMAQLVPSLKKNECGVVEALGHVRAREAVAPMIELMPGQPTHHHCIHDALRAIGDRAAIPLLQQLLEKTKERYQQYQIEEVIQHLEKHATEG